MLNSLVPTDEKRKRHIEILICSIASTYNCQKFLNLPFKLLSTCYIKRMFYFIYLFKCQHLNRNYLLLVTLSEIMLSFESICCYNENVRNKLQILRKKRVIGKIYQNMTQQQQTCSVNCGWLRFTVQLRPEPQKREDDVALSLLIRNNGSKQRKQASLPSNGSKVSREHLLETLLVNIECVLIQPQKLSDKMTLS